PPGPKWPRSPKQPRGKLPTRAMTHGRHSWPWRNIEPAHYCRSRQKHLQHAIHLGKVLHPHQLTGTIERVEYIDPRKNGDVSDGVVRSHHPIAPREVAIEHAEQPLRFPDITVARPLV